MRRIRLLTRLVAPMTAAVAFAARAVVWSRRHPAAPRHAIAFAAPAPSEQTQTEPTKEAAEEAPAGQPPPGIHMPHPTIWPLVVGLGITLIAFGIVTHWAFSLLGILLILWAIGGWIQELRHG